MADERVNDRQVTEERQEEATPVSRRAFLRGLAASAAATVATACAPQGEPARPLAAPYNTATPARVLASPQAPATGTPEADSGPPPAGSIPLEQFLMLSTVLTGIPNLDPVVGNVYLQSLQASDEFDVTLADLFQQAGLSSEAPPATIAALEERGIFAGEATKTLADKIIEVWYTGVYTTAEGEPAVATFVDALAWKALHFTKPNSICGSPGFWEKRPEVYGLRS
ncbi:MAG: sugar dehydrogenase complex small subunit [Anaerolineae bacterium]|nr:sugar dehydrogenase complex small subunit [Anaerolineae bacterium]